MTAPTTCRPTRSAVASALPPAVENAASRLLDHRDAVRPVTTLAWAASAGMAAAFEEPGAQPGLANRGFPMEVWLGALFYDWKLYDAPLTEAEARPELAVLGPLLSSQRAVLPRLPAYPARPALTPAILDKLWHHLDLAGWRFARFPLDPRVEDHLDAREGVGLLLLEGVGLLAQFRLMMGKAFTGHGASARDYIEELASLLRRMHNAMDRAAQAAGDAPLGWSIPDYTPFLAEAYPLPEGPRGTALPESLAPDLQKALDARGCPRPLGTALPMVLYYAELKRALDPEWAWSPAMDGRECAFILFESGLEDLPDWTPAQARELTRLCTALHAWSNHQPVPPLPPLLFDAADDHAEALWLHQDILFLIGSVLAMDLGVLSHPDELATSKRQERLHQQWSDYQSLIWGTLFHWASIPHEDRSMLAASLSKSMGAVYQVFRNEIARVDRSFLRFVPKPPENLAPRAKAAILNFGRTRKR